MKAWPIDPLALRDLKLEVSEKLLLWLLYSPVVRPRLVGVALLRASERRSAMHPMCGDTLKPGLPSGPSQSGRGHAATVDTVTRPPDESMGDPQPSPWRPDCVGGEGKVQRLDGCGSSSLSTA